MSVTVKIPEGEITFHSDISPEKATQLAKTMMFATRYGSPTVRRSDLARQIEEVESQKNQYGDK